MVALAALVFTGANAQEAERYHQFTDTKTVPATSVKDQNKSGTCWSFSTLAMMESELLRTGKGEYDLSAMWVARHVYFEKVVKYVRMHGKMNLAEGGWWSNVPDVIRKYGIVPTSAYSGLNYGLDNHDHAELSKLVIAYADAVIKGKLLTTAWQDGLNGILDAYFGQLPENFDYNGKNYTPASFRDMLGLDMDDYISLASFTHHPFNAQFVIEVPDNWTWSPSYNVTQQELLDATVGALEKGYTAVWSADVSEPGFAYNSGIAFNVPASVETEEGTELAKWVSVSTNQRAEMVKKLLKGPVAEPEYTQEQRQLAYDNYETTDDHGMLLTGLAVDQDGRHYFKVKNSWTDANVYKGYFYASYPYFTYKTLSVAVNRNALSKELRKKLGID